MIIKKKKKKRTSFFDERTKGFSSTGVHEKILAINFKNIQTSVLPSGRNFVVCRQANNEVEVGIF